MKTNMEVLDRLLPYFFYFFLLFYHFLKNHNFALSNLTTVNFQTNYKEQSRTNIVYYASVELKILFE